jgi:D,D-heptose 1,7-bisphosphate phosphatase
MGHKEMAMMRDAIFLDKDGTLVENVPFNADPREIRLTSGAAKGLKTLHKLGYALIIISNQPGIAMGYFSEDGLGEVEACLRELLLDADVPLAGFYYCPHHPQGRVSGYAVACTCRKPAPGLLLRAASDHGLALERSWFVGDILDDIETGRRAGCKTVLLDNGNETEWQVSPQRMPHYFAHDLAEAASQIAWHHRKFNGGKKPAYGRKPVLALQQ